MLPNFFSRLLKSWFNYTPIVQPEEEKPDPLLFHFHEGAAQSASLTNVETIPDHWNSTPVYFAKIPARLIVIITPGRAYHPSKKSDTAYLVPLDNEFYHWIGKSYFVEKL